MHVSKVVTWAGTFFSVAALFILISFVSPYWLVTDGKLVKPKFLRLGLWEVCFHNFTDQRYWYPDVTFNSCWWIFEEEYYIIHDLLLRDFFVATQFFFTVTFTFCLIAVLLLMLYCTCSKNHDRFITLLLTLGAIIVSGGISGLISVIIFGAYGDGRDWMPNWEHNDIGWAYALGTIGILLLFPAGVLFLIEARVHKYKRLQEIQSREQSAYNLEERKVAYIGGHTDI